MNIAQLNDIVEKELGFQRLEEAKAAQKCA